MIIIFIIEIHWLEKNKVFSEMSDLKAKKNRLPSGGYQMFLHGKKNTLTFSRHI